MRSRNTLLLLPALAASTQDSRVVLTQKFIEGAQMYAMHWPGRVVIGLLHDTMKGDNLDYVCAHPSDHPFDIEWLLPSNPHGLDSLLADSSIVLATLIDRHVDLGVRCAMHDTPLVYMTEYSERTRRQIIHADTSNPVLRWKRARYSERMEQQFRRAISTAAGVQCNGLPTFTDYRPLNDNSFLFFDSRIRSDDLTTKATIAQRYRDLVATTTLRLAYSGRLIRMKGVDHLPLVADALRRLGVTFTLDIFGDGALEPQLRNDIHRLGLSSFVRLNGVHDFRTQLLPSMRESIDLFVCCHPQGDPSCTYLETMACGTPIVGYDNDAFAGLASLSGAGWTSPMNDPVALARLIHNLWQQQSLLLAHSYAALTFASQHTFESTFANRVAHLTNTHALHNRSTFQEAVAC